MAGGIRMKKTIILLLSLLILSGCTYETEEKTIYGELTDAGYILDEIDITDLDFEVTVVSAKSIHDSLSDDFGIIYEVSNEDVESFYTDRQDYSYYVNDIVFIYKVENYVLEMYHSTTSTFAGFMRHYDFEANFQYELFFSGEMEYHPLIQRMLDNGGYIWREETEEHIVEYHDAYNRLNLQIESIRIIPFNNVSYTVVQYKSSEEAYQAFIYQDTLNAGTFNSFRYYVQYQNYVFIIDVLNVHIDLIYTPFEDVDFVAYSHEDAQYLPWEGN